MDFTITPSMFLLSSAAAAVSSGIAIPEPSNWALFGLGVAGVLIGRFGLRPRRRDDDEK